VGTSLVALSADFRNASTTSRSDGGGAGAPDVGVVVSEVVVGVGSPAARASSSTSAVACRGDSGFGRLGRRGSQLAVVTGGCEFGFQRVGARRLAAPAGRRHRADEDQRQQTTAAVGEDAAAAQHRHAGSRRAGIGGGIWVEHANILPLPPGCWRILGG
jgi:hypothetical protein